MEPAMLMRAQRYGCQNQVPYTHCVKAFMEGSQELTRMAQRYVHHIQSQGIATEVTLLPMWELVGKLIEWSGTPTPIALTEDSPPF